MEKEEHNEKVDSVNKHDDKHEEHSHESHHKHEKHGKEHHEKHEHHQAHKENHKEKHAHSEEHKKHPKKQRVDDVVFWKVTSAVLAVILFVVIMQCYAGKSTEVSNVDVAMADLGPALDSYKDDIANGAIMGSKDAKIVVVEFSDFQCPYCKRFHEETLNDLKEKYVDTGKVLFVYRNLPLPFHSNAMVAALASECAKEQGKFWEYHDKLFENQGSLDKSSLKGYAKDLGLDEAKFNECLDSEKYKDQVQKDADYAKSKGLSGTPSFLINGVPLVGAQPLAAFESQFEALSNPIKFKVYILNDKGCPTCSDARLEQVTRQLFPTAEFERIDVSDDMGKKFINDMNIKLAPALIFEKKVTETAGWKNNERIQPLFKEFGDYYLLDPEAVGSVWIIDPVEREKALQKTYEMLGLKKGDNKPQVDFFVMSYCPYGNQAEELLKPVYDKLKDSAEFKPRYVIYPQGNGCMEDSEGNKYCSLHGAQELHQDIRELCVYNDLGQDKWFEFALAMNDKCTSSNADSCWEDVAKDIGLDVAKIKKCEEEQGLELVKKEYELNQLLGVTGSPTLFFEGQQYNGARTEQGYLAALCSGFDEKPEVCNNIEEVASNDSPAPVPTGSCG